MRRVGWAVGSTDGSRPTWGVFRSPSWGTEEGKHLLRFRRWLAQTHADYRLDAVFYEAGFPGDSVGSEAHDAKTMLFGEIVVFAEEHGLVCRKVPIQSWRSRFIGTTQAPPHFRRKPDMARAWLKQRAIAACAERGWLTDIDDEAEALGILDFGLCSLDVGYLGRTDTIFRRRQFDADKGAVA